MPAVSPYELVDAIISAIQESGYSGILIGKVRTHPRHFLVNISDDENILVWVYIWTLTFGGRPKPSR